MHMNTLTGRDAALQVLRERGVGVLETPLSELRNHEPRLFQDLRDNRPLVVLVDADNMLSVDVMALRWLFRGGVTPLVLCPSNAFECAELASVAGSAAELIRTPVFLLLENGVGEDVFTDEEPEPPEVSWDEPPPTDEVIGDASGLLDEDGIDEEAAILLRHENRLKSPLKGFKSASFTPCDAEAGRPEWLLVSYGSGAKQAREAATQAAESGMRLHQLVLRQLWPVPEPELLKAAMGVQHVVVAEGNLGQYAQEVRRLLPEPAVIPAGGPGGVTAKAVLARLQRSPRCC